ncbi:MAG: pyridoxamine kinase [Ruminococcaceae bacterium]|nr:pyridoxamine kinase [Oscillospiraceae bacterium]
MVSHTVKRVAAINDISGFSRCSLTVAMPIISAMGHHCCPYPTAILSNNTEHKDFFFDDYTDKMESYASYWKQLNIKFDCIYTGFLGSEKQIDIVRNFITDFKTESNIILVDPVMADNGKIYSTYTRDMCLKMKELVKDADVITPNITEACILSGEEYEGENISLHKAEIMCKRITELGVKTIVITGIRENNKIINYIYTNNTSDFVKIDSVDVYYSGTGDVFASVLCGALTSENDIHTCVKIASEFVEKTVIYSKEAGIYPNEGVGFEKFLSDLSKYKKI